MHKIKLVSILCLLGLIAPANYAQNKKDVSKKEQPVVFYFARHGKTILNTMDRVQGWADAPLTPQGVEVAVYLGVGLTDIPFKAAYSSDLGRARQTARIVLDSKGQKEMKVTEVPNLRETNFGSYEGELNQKMWNDAALYLHYKSVKELRDAMLKNNDVLKDAIASFKALETLGIGEDYNEVKERGQKAIKEIAAKEAAAGGGNVLVVGHGMSIGVFLSDLDSSGKKTGGSHMENASVCKVIYKDGEFSLESFGDMSYVEKGKIASGK